MRIKQIEIDNFKSFRNNTVIPFLEGFTTISGPNGSGKSNIVDCILFALGLSSSRTLRAEKLTDLINNMSQKREASVKIIFFDDRDNKEFDIKRKIKEGPNGYTSTYYLDGHTSTLAEIHKTLGDYNVSPGCYNVMMQGDVTGIINMSPSERRKIIDEIAGVAEFDRRIEQAEKEIQTVQDRVDRSCIILGEIDARIEQLSSEREQALKYQKLKDERQVYSNQVSLVKYKDLKNSINVVQENISDTNNEKNNVCLRINTINDDINEAKKLFDELNEKVKIKGEDEFISLTRQSETFKGEIFRKNQEIDFNSNKINENKNAIQKAHREIQSLTETIDDINLKIDNRKDLLNTLNSQISSQNEEMRNLLEEQTSLGKAAQGFIEKRNQLRKDLESLEDEEGRLKREDLKWEDIINRSQCEINDLEKDLSSFDEDKDTLANNKIKLEKEIKELLEEKSAFEIQLNSTINNIKKHKEDLTISEDKIRKYYRQLMQLEANKRASEDANLGRAIEVVLNSGLSGIHKTLSQLGRVDKEYATALETAMGSRMRNIIVDNEHVGAKAIEHLKRSNAGRATFLPLNKITYYPLASRIPNINGVIDFAINLIEFDIIYKNAFFYALGETLVVENLDVAKHLMGEFRMVTLDGSLVEKTGAMTGGSLARSNLKFSSNTDEEISELGRSIKGFESEKSSLAKTIDELEKNMDRYRNDYSSCLNTIHSKKIELENTENKLNNVGNSLQGKIDRLNELGSKLSETQILKQSIEEELQEILEKIQNTRNQIQEADAGIPQDKLEQIEELTGNIEFEIKSLESKTRNVENEISRFELDKDFKKQSLDYQKERITDCEQEIIKLEEDNVKKNLDINTIDKRLEELSSSIEHLSKELKEIQKERDLASKKLLELEHEKDTLNHTIKRLEESLLASNTRKKDLISELSILKNELKEQNIDLSGYNNINLTSDEIIRSIEKLSKRMEALEPVNMLAIREYDEVQERKSELEERIKTLSNEKEEINNRLNGYENLKKQAFIITFENVDRNFREIFADLSDGEGRLILENSENVFKGGLTIEARPRGKKLLRLEAMSGGEKSLTALAFVFAFQRYMPAPFYAFDEVDMFLDGVNVEKLAHMIRKQSSSAQFIVVSLRKPMIEKANRTLGVTQRRDGISKVTGVVLHE